MSTELTVDENIDTPSTHTFVKDRLGSSGITESMHGFLKSFFQTAAEKIDGPINAIVDNSKEAFVTAAAGVGTFLASRKARLTCPR